MTKSDTWIPIYIGDYLADTSRLTTEGHGAYLLLIMDYWRNGAPPDNDATLAAITKLPLPRWRRLRPVLLPMFRLTEGQWHHKRIDAELEKAASVTAERSAAGKAGAAVRWGKRHGKTSVKPMANAMATASQNDAPSQSQDSVANATDAGASFEADGDDDLKTRIFGPALDWLRKQTGRSSDKLRPLVGKWCSQHGDGRTLEALQQAARNAPLDPIPYVEKLLAGGGKASSSSGFTNGFAQMIHEGKV